jgi:hypothetical protein
MTEDTPRAWRYAAGQWAEDTDIVGTTWRDGESDTAAIERAGYVVMHSVGNASFGLSLTLWARKEVPRHIVRLSGESMCEFIYTDTLPDALDLLTRWAPFVRDDALLALLDDLNAEEPGLFGVVESIARRAAWGAGQRYGLAPPQRRRP